MGIGVAIVVVGLIILLIARPGLAFVLLVVAGVLFAVLWNLVEKQNAERLREREAEERARPTIAADDLSVNDISLQPFMLEGEFILQGTVTNNSTFPLQSLQFEIACPSSDKLRQMAARLTRVTGSSGFSLCDFPLMLQASILDCGSFDPFSFQQDCLTAPEVDVGRR